MFAISNQSATPSSASASLPRAEATSDGPEYVLLNVLSKFRFRPSGVGILMCAMPNDARPNSAGQFGPGSRPNVQQHCRTARKVPGSTTRAISQTPDQNTGSRQTVATCMLAIVIWKHSHAESQVTFGLHTESEQIDVID